MLLSNRKCKICLLQCAQNSFSHSTVPITMLVETLLKPWKSTEPHIAQLIPGHEGVFVQKSSHAQSLEVLSPLRVVYRKHWRIIISQARAEDHILRFHYFSYRLIWMMHTYGEVSKNEVKGNIPKVPVPKPWAHLSLSQSLWHASPLCPYIEFTYSVKEAYESSTLQFSRKRPPSPQSQDHRFV